MALKVGSNGNEHSDRQSSVQYLRVLADRQDLCFSKACGPETANPSTTDSSVAFLSTPRTDVSGIRSHLRWNPSSIHLSSSFRGPTRRLACSDRDSCVGEKRFERPNPGVGLQRRRNPGSLRCYSSGHNLSSATLHRSSLLDSCILGSRLVGDALHYFRFPFETLEERLSSEDALGARLTLASAWLLGGRPCSGFPPRHGVPAEWLSRSWGRGFSRDIPAAATNNDVRSPPCPEPRRDPRRLTSA